MKGTIALALLVLVANAQVLNATDNQPNQSVGRYTQITLKPTGAQIDVLSDVMQIDFPPHITTVGTAIQYLLQESGYRLADLEHSDPAMPILLGAPLPQAHRKLGPIRMRTALSVLSSQAWVLVEDPVHRLISFELADQYRLKLNVSD